MTKDSGQTVRHLRVVGDLPPEPDQETFLEVQLAAQKHLVAIREIIDKLHRSGGRGELLEIKKSLVELTFLTQSKDA